MKEIEFILERIYEYDNFRKFLNDFFEEGKKISTKLSKRYFAKKAGFTSHSFIIQVIKGEKNLSLESIKKVAKALELDGKKKEYFINLVLYNQAQTIEEKKMYFDKLKEIRQNIMLYELKDVKEYILFHDWYYPIVREVAAVLNTKDPEVIAKNVYPNITTKAAKEALERLFEAGFLVDENGNIKQNYPFLTARKLPPVIYNSQKKEYILKAVDALDNLSAKERHISYVTCTITEKDYPKVEELIDEFRKKVLTLATTNPYEDQKVMQLNIQFFPVSNVLRRTEDEKV